MSDCIKIKQICWLSKLEQLEQELDDNEVTIDNIKIPTCKCYCVKAGKLKCIAIDIKQIKSKAEKLCLLAHEREHLEHQELMYGFDEPIYERKRKEKIIEKRVIKRLVPFDKLRKLSLKGYNNFEIAQELEVTQELVKKAIDFYLNNY